MRHYIVALLAFGLSASGCNKKQEVLSPSEGASGTGKVVLKVTYRRPHGLAKPAVVDRMTAYVYEADNTEIVHKDLERVGNMGRTTITLSAGNDRKVSVVAYEDTLVKWIGWDDDVDVVAGQTTTAEIEMGYTVPELEVPDTSSTGSYTVRWGRVPGALRYILEEGGSEVYTGVDTTYGVEGKEQGSYVYRVKAEVGYSGARYGYSPWSDEVEVVVSLREEGGIEIEVPWPEAGVNIEGIEFVLVPGGEFQMGDIWGDGYFDEKPVHTVRVGDFYMSKYEITVGQFRRFCDATGRSMPDQPGWDQRDDYPVVNVRWYDAVSFCNWLSRQAGLEEVYDESTWEADFSKVGYRLPTEAEWEYAARAGGKEIKYPNGNLITHDEVNYGGTGGRDQWDSIAPVGSFPPTELGLYDMAGNVKEWCNDWYSWDYYSHSPVDNPTGPPSGEYRVLRGGGCYSTLESCRTVARDQDDPDFALYSDVGFRVVLPVR